MRIRSSIFFVAEASKKLIEHTTKQFQKDSYYCQKVLTEILSEGIEWSL